MASLGLARVLTSATRLALAGGEGARPDCLHERGWEEHAHILQRVWGGAYRNRTRMAQAAYGVPMAGAAELTRPVALWV